MTYEIEYNARSVPPAEVARSFIPPEPHFVRLLSRNHTLIVGPRGSGKTTLLKMLTVRALRSWDHEKAAEYARQVTFNAAFVPADTAWGRQIDALDKLGGATRKKEAAFIIHTLRAVVYAMREASELSKSGNSPPHLAHLCAELSPENEDQFVRLISKSFSIIPALATLLGLEVALEDRLNSINSGDDIEIWSVDALPSMLRVMITAFNGFIGDDERRWAILFDELEIAPTSIKQFILSGIRSFDQRIVVKLAMAPHMEDAGFELSPTSAQPLHDYLTVQLTYPNKEDAIDFTSALFVKTLQRFGIDKPNLPALFAPPLESRGFGRRVSGARPPKVLPEEFERLAQKDESFHAYVSQRGINSETYSLVEENLASDVRKALPIVIARDYYLKGFVNGKVTAHRSRKSHSLYTGYPSILEVTEGNPRAILTLIGPLAQEHVAQLESSPTGTRISSSQQSSAIRRVEFLLTSLLRVIPLDLGGFDQHKGLLDFIDKIGRAFEGKLLRSEFSPDYTGSFTLDENVTPGVISAVGKALNAGALVHIPYKDSGQDSLLRGLTGQRFRLSYALSARYRLLLTVGDKISLSRLFIDSQGGALVHYQQSLFDQEDSLDN